MAGPPLLVMLGRRGRWEVVSVLREEPGPWTLRGLAHAARIPHQVAGRAVLEREALGAVEWYRPGRDAAVTWRAAAPAARWLAALVVPDLRAEAAAAFARAMPGRRVLWWTLSGEEDDPLAPARVAVVDVDPDDALDAATAGLDAVTAAMLPPVAVTTVTPEALEGQDAVAARIRAGTAL